MTKHAWAILCALLLGLAAGAAGAAPRITEVRVRGNLRVESGLVLQKVKIRPGDVYDPAAIREDIQAIYATGYFEDIAVELDDQGVLTFVVRERPALRDWRVEGSDAVDKEDVEKAVTLKRREILDRAQVEESARAIRDLYREKGYYLATVTSDVVPVEDGKNHVDVVYRVQEGEKVRLKRLHLMGMEKEDADDVRKFLSLSEAGWWSWLTGSGTFQEADLERDREVIRAYYLNRGFVQVDVKEPLVTLTEDRRWLNVDIPVVEGESFQVGAIRFSGDQEFPEAELRQAVGMKKGATFSSEDFRGAVDALTDLYADVGYAFVEVDPRTRLDAEARTVDLDFEIHKGPIVHIGRIEVRGNTKTRDRIVRREMRLAEGELYSGTAIKKSRRKIQNLGFFEKVNLTTHRRPGTDLVDVDIEVEEKATGAFSVGAGYSSVDKIVGMASVSQRNFLGYGYQLALQGNFGTTRETYSFTFNNPRVFDSEVYAGVDVYKSIREYSFYDKNSFGGDVKLGTALGENWRTRWTYRWEKAKVRILDTTEDISQFVMEQVGTITTSSITPSLNYDTRDDPWEPHHGAQAEWSVEWAGGLLGGDAAFLKYGFDGSKYFPLWWDHVLTLHASAGFIQPLQGRSIPIYERYYLGGINSLRGFGTRDVGPEDPETGEVIGGDKELLFNVEYLFPLVPEAKVRGVLFFDAGNAWDVGQAYLETSLRRSAGAGVRWFSPMGPLRLEWGYVLDRKEGEDSSQWEFSIGGFF